MRRGANTVRIHFTAGDAPMNRSDDLLYTLFVPAHARQALPCFDQPDLKGRWSVTVEHPAAWRAIANGAELERRELGTRARVRFAQTKPLPTYLVSLAVGKFQVETAKRDGRTMRMFHRETDTAKLARITDPDRRARFEFVRPALASDALVRERWFGQLADQANRRHEVWVAEGLRRLNHPLRAASSAPLVAPALAMVLTVNRTGNLFFDTAWLAAVLNGHSSPAVAEAVQQFLAEMPPDYPPRLRALVLQRADLLMRAARLRPS